MSLARFAVKSVRFFHGESVSRPATGADGSNQTQSFVSEGDVGLFYLPEVAMLELKYKGKHHRFYPITAVLEFQLEHLDDFDEGSDPEDDPVELIPENGVYPEIDVSEKLAEKLEGSVPAVEPKPKKSRKQKPETS